MRLLFTAILSILPFLTILAQNRIITGHLTSNEDGSPLPGINISIKGTTIGTTTDANGYYSIEVPIGATLVFSFIGMQSREVVVTENNLQPVSSGNRQRAVRAKRNRSTFKPIPRNLLQDTTLKNDVGIASLTDETPSYRNQSTIDPTTIRSIKPRSDVYIIKSDTDPIRRTGFALQFSSSIGLEQVNRLPDLQNQYSQGRTNGNNLQWNGADQLEIFSWGPLIRKLEFDGSNYPYDHNGMLVPVGTGNGEPAKNYDPLSFFKTGFTNVNELMMAVPIPGNGTLIFDFENRSRTGVIPDSEYKKTGLTTSLKNYKLAKSLTANASIAFNKSSGSLLQRGANLTSITGSVFRAPISFDNANGLSATMARGSNESYQFADGSKRSHAPGLSDNPYGLINELPDNENLHRLLITANLHYDPEYRFSINFNGDVDRQWNSSIFGTPPGYSGYLDGRLTSRKDNQTFANGILTAALQQYFGTGELKVRLSYQLEHTARELRRQDGFNFLANDSYGNINEADSIITLNKNINRAAHEIIVNAQYAYYNGFSIQFSNRSYFSNTINRKQFTNFFPSGSLSIDFANLLDLWPMDVLNVYTTLSRTLREAPLIYSNWSYGSTELPVENYSNFYESNEIFFNKSIAPETELKFETGLKLRAGRFSAEMAYFNNLTKDFIQPVTTLTGTELSNTADIQNIGGIISAGYTGYILNGSWGIDLRWSKYNSVVKELHSTNEWIAIGGFQSAQTVLVQGKPAGAIYGTTYLRNTEGKRIIDNDGFPIKDTSLKMIGNPIPDWLLGWSSFMQWKQWKFSFLLDFKKGGEIWNGTNSMLDYLGRSSGTANLRNTTNYIFEGVDLNGDVNLIPVTFFDPAKPITENRWVRYGWDGIGEDYIEDASWIRLNELVVSYTSRHSRNSTIKGFKLSLIGRNLLLFTPYSGVDPSASLFGYNTGNGLDLFNAPATRSYSAQITIKI